MVILQLDLERPDGSTEAVVLEMEKEELAGFIAQLKETQGVPRLPL